MGNGPKDYKVLLKDAVDFYNFCKITIHGYSDKIKMSMTNIAKCQPLSTILFPYIFFCTVRDIEGHFLFDYVNIVCYT